MAYKDSGEIANNSNYALGDYSFRIERTSVPGSSNDQITAICTQGGKNARKSIQIPSSAQISNWYVEANETTADVYITIPGESEPGDIVPFLPAGNIIEFFAYYVWRRAYTDCDEVFWINQYGNVDSMLVSKQNTYESTYWTWREGETPGEPHVTGGPLSSHYEKDGKIVYYGGGYNNYAIGRWAVSPPFFTRTPTAEECWKIEYESQGFSGTFLVGRFAIELEDAGGVGPGSDWTDPGDYDPNWEEGDPTHTLYVTVTGALSGRHNDPIEDPSYSYIPADKDIVKDYGCGGDGGHGGGGGAGASTVVIHKFATNQANSKEVTAIARRHGYGSGGGKGGKGGDGCILVYY